jgi:CheY-like chemotaxis protein
LARKILLADDSVTAQNMGRKILADAGYEVITVNNGSAALKKIGETKPDLIVLDVYMPGYSGLEVCQRLKEVGDSSRIPILLTVGKLEPFKPEEARRVRADGYIVKPFEASELLSALSKLEDKIVPRSESSKPGRFARATAAIDEGRRDNTYGDDDSGWKNRIAFPAKKKQEAAPEPEADDPAIYNPVNKDLRTVIEHHEPEVQPKAAATEERVDVGALAPEGLPKDVTPEEIAAIAAAAAQVQATILESKTAETRGDLSAAPAESQAESTNKSAEPVAESKQAAESSAAIQHADASAEISNSMSVAGRDVGSSSDSSAQLSAERAGDEPVTMAVAAGAEFVSSRWTAVAVALAPEEAAVSLDQEMQKAYAEFAAAEFKREASEPQAPSTEPAAVVASETESAPEASSAMPASEIPQAAADVGAATKEPESVAGEHVENAVSTATPESAGSSEPDVREHEAAEAPAPEVAQPDLKAATEPESPEAISEPTSPPIPVVTNEGNGAEAHQVSAETTTPAPTEPGGNGHMGKKEKESDIAATTAAAWASWRKIRESGDSTPAAEPSANDEAAMAVAAGAEHNPEEVTDPESDPAIASIVDSVLANLRPKIVEEISRKLGKKK